jgi:ABC-type dipeptide/oligopeptide/nickel transport system permease subunit
MIERIQHRPQRASRNWPLFIGSLLIALVTLIAVAGPSLALHDPLKRTNVIRVDGDWLNAPFPPFVAPGFPLGSDALGRDVLSNLLWAVRPTLIIVLIVAVLRLSLGTVIGVTAGWSLGRAGKILDTLIFASMSAPVLIVALAVVAVLNFEVNLWPFVIGLSLTGWAETARIVREQTRSIKGQPYIEAARALGQSDWGLIARHVLRQIMPMVWMLFAFEISNTLLVTAALGFFGYYLGGEVWVTNRFSDYAADRVSGLPDLGLMLSTLTTDIFIGPWKMLAAGSMVFITVLGFNLLGEGLRRRLSIEQLGRRETRLSLALERIGYWIEGRALGAQAWTTRYPARAVLLAVSIVLLAGSVFWWQAQAAAQAEAAKVEEAIASLPIPGGHLWAAERHDPYGTLQTDAPGLEKPNIGWIFEDASGFSGGPVVASDGTVYIVSYAGTLYALDAAGQVKWQVILNVRPVHSPALGPHGDIYLADQAGGLSAVNAKGELEWQRPLERGEATAGPIVGPDGAIYYTIAGQVRAVSPEGKQLWLANAWPTRVSTPPHLDPGGDWVYLRGGALNAKDGSLQALPELNPRDQIIVGGDGRRYFRYENRLSAWQRTDSGIEVQPVEWDQRGAFGNSEDSGVTASGTIWLIYTTFAEDARLVWVDHDGQNIGDAIRYPHRPGRIIAFDRNSTAYACSHRRNGGAECLAFAPGIKEPLWQLSLPKGETVAGGALLPGRLYVTVEEGFLYAVDGN